MALFHFEENKNYRFGIWKMDEDENALIEFLGYEVFVQFSNPGKRVEFLSVRALAKLMKIDPQSIAYLPSGKPYLKNNSTSISISHTKGYAAIMLSDMQNIGIDIEHKSERVKKIRSKFMHPREEDNLLNQPGNESIALLLHWSAKESIFKAIPDEGVDFLKELEITNFTSPVEKGHFRAKALRSGMEFEIDYRVENDFVLTACYPSTINKSR